MRAISRTKHIDLLCKWMKHGQARFSLGASMVSLSASLCNCHILACHAIATGCLDAYASEALYLSLSQG